MSNRLDLIDLIDLGYRLDGDDRARHAALAGAHQTLCGRPLGSVVAAYQWRPDGRLVFERKSVAAVETDPRQRSVLLRALEAASARNPRALSLFFGALYVGTLSQRGQEAETVSRPFLEDLRGMLAPIGILDVQVVCAANLDGHGLVLLSPLPERRSVDHRSKRLWTAAAAHLAAGDRLRRALAGMPAIHDAEAVVDEAGEVTHAAGRAKQDSARERLRQSVRAMNRAHQDDVREHPEQALAFWQALVDGRWTLLDHFDGDGRRFVVARANEPTIREPRALTRRERQVASLAAQGHSNRVIGYMLGLSEGTVAVHLHRGMAKLGIDRRVGLASLHLTATRVDRLIDGQVGDTPLEVASAPAPRLPSALSPAERDVTQAVLRGLTDAQIAAARGVSARTIGNQLTNVYRKLGVASRSELVARLGAGSPPRRLPSPASQRLLLPQEAASCS